MNKISNEQEVLINIARKVLEPDKFNLNKVDADIDWMVMLRLAISHRVFPIVYKFLKNYIPSNFISAYAEEYYKFTIKNDALIDELKNIYKLAKTKGINLLMIKGIVLSKIIYDDLYIRQYNDIDILLKEQDVYKMDALLRSSGYVHLGRPSILHDNLKKDKPKLLELSRPVLKTHYHHEYFEYVKKFSDDLVISTELGRYIHSTIKKAEHIECLMNETQEVDISGMSIKTMDFHHTLLILFENAYSGVSRYTGIMRIKDYVDIFVFVKEYSKEINWVKLQSLANKYEMLHQVRDIINYLNLLYNDVIPKDVIELFSHKQATYKIERCETNYIFEWESSFFDRLFNNDLRKTEINRLLKKRCYSNDNTHYCNPIKLREISELDVANLDKYYSFNDDKYKYSIKFFPSYKGNNLYFHIYLDSEVLGLLDKFFITISFLEKDAESSIVWRRFMIEHKNSKLVVCFNQKEIADANIHRIHQGGIIEVKIPFSELSIDIVKVPIKLGFNLLLQEYIYEHEITHVIGAKHKICWQTSCWDCGILEIPDLL